MPYRVLMIVPTSFFGDYGGHIRIYEEARVLQQMGHRVCLVTYPLGRGLPELDIRRARRLPWRARYEVGSSRHKLALDALLAVKVLQTARQFRPDVLHAHMHEGALIGSLVSRVFAVPLVFDFQGSMTAEMVDHHFLDPDGPFYRPLKKLERWIDRQPQATLTSSRNAATILAGELGGAERIVPLPDCVDGERLQPVGRASAAVTALRERLGIPDTRRIVVYLGLLADYQGTRELMRAAQMVLHDGVDAHFLVMGFPGVPQYAELARELGIEARVSLPGKIAYEEIATWLSLGQVAVAPKMSKTEGNGKILNYMALALPVVAFDTPVAREYLDTLGVYAPVGDTPALAEAIKGVLADPEGAQSRGQALRTRVLRQFSWAERGREIEAVYARVCGEEGQRTSRPEGKGQRHRPTTADPAGERVSESQTRSDG